MTERKGKKSVEPKQLALAVLLTVLVLAVTLLASRKADNKDVTQIPSTLTEEKVEEEIKDGVYTNYTYGFRFEYPSDKFHSDPNGRLIYQNPDGIQYILLISTVYPNSQYREWYEQIFNLSKNETTLVRYQYSTLLSKFERDGYRLAITSTKTKEGAETEHSIGYQAFWLMPNDLTITISMFGDPEISEEFVLKNKLIFDEIVNSFEFISQ